MEKESIGRSRMKLCDFILFENINKQVVIDQISGVYNRNKDFEHDPYTNWVYFDISQIPLLIIALKQLHKDISGPYTHIRIGA